MRLKHVDLDQRRIYQDGREVRTKFAKSFPTFFSPVGNDIEQIIAEWVNFLRSERLWGLDDPLFSKTLVRSNADRHFEAQGLSRECWSNATPIRKIFREAFESAGLPYFNPHSFRKTLARFGQQVCQSPEAFKAWSQNLGHEKVLTTFKSYGPVGIERRAELIRSAGRQSQAEGDVATILRNIANNHERATKNRSAPPLASPLKTDRRQSGLPSPTPTFWVHTHATERILADCRCGAFASVRESVNGLWRESLTL